MSGSFLRGWVQIALEAGCRTAAFLLRITSVPRMTRRFSIKEIAFRAGRSPARVDRALHGRDHVRSLPQGRRFTLDIFIQSPGRFSLAVQAAFEAERPLARPEAFRARFHLAEIMVEREIIDRLTAIARRGSHGSALKLPATPAIETCLEGIVAQGIPLVICVTDIAAPRRPTSCSGWGGARGHGC